MKWMKYFLVLAMGLAMGFGTAGCSSDDDGGGDSLVGSWRAATFNGQAMPAGIALTLTFRDNGTVDSASTINGVTEMETATWSEANGIITVVSADGTEQVPYSISGNTLTISDSEGVFTLERQ